ncbi:hypothetical protein Nepgr_025195 [Nepenthes gracilis]|uniref:Endonuclease/exonuclease/phosphatase domain-containing protein n=1 Tax=Nepenthes gracilis TaxID=150966 RepID=A0AAD3XZB1_NEPGR|nr:hypothetical protein Nepgr_025195 [Nepenthes gracilis]
MRDEHRGERPASRFLASVDGCHSSSLRWQGKRNRRKSESADGLRKWVYAKRDCSGFKDKVVIVSYNVLGVENVTKHPDLYFNIPPKYLGWDHRKELLRKEIKNYHPGILCFQEVDRFNDLEDALQRDGFKGVYQARTGDAPDGCAIFWNNERFTLLHEEHMEFQSFGLRNNVAQFCVLQMSSNQLISDTKSKSKAARSSRSMVVGNIHVLFNPNRGDIKLGQIRLFLERAHKLAEEWGKIPVVLAGDLNSVPQSAVYQFMSSAELDLSRHDRKRISGQMDIPLKSSIFQSQQEGFPRWNGEELKLATGDEHVTCLLHYLKLCSAYPGVPGNLRTRDSMGEPLATSCHSKFMGTVDYIWHTEELIPVRVLDTLPVNVLRKMGGLPNKKWGSDHLALACEFAFA